MRKLLFGVFLAGLTVPVFAYGDWDRDDRYDRDNGNHRGWYKHDRDNRDYRNGPYRNDPYDNYGYRDYGRGGNYPYGSNYPYGNSGRYGNSPVSNTLNNLSRISSRGFVDRHERDHFSKAMQNLQDFEYRYRQGQFESSRLDRAIDEMKHLASANQLHPGDRQIIARDIENLRAFRSTGGRYSRGYPF